MRLLHTMLRVNNLDESLKFYCDTLGFRVSDWRSDFFAFLDGERRKSVFASLTGIDRF